MSLDFDIRSAIMVGALLNALIAIMLLIVRKTLPANFQNSLSWWWFGLLLQPAGFVLIAMRGQLPAVVSVVLANMMIAAALACFAIAMRMFTGVRQRRSYAVILVFFAGFFAIYYSDDLLSRIVSLSILHTLLLAFGARAIYRQELKITRVSHVLAGLFVIGAFSMAARAVYHVVSQDPIIDIFSMRWPTILSYGMGGLLPIVGTIGFLLMCTERSQKDLERMASEDPLTGAYNRRALAEFGMREMARARRHGIPLSVILIDIDYFKKINDELGHAAGDLALIETVRRLQKNLRSEDYLGRMGGEEFLVLLPDTDIEQAQVLAQRIREEFASQPMLLLEQQRSITLSGGITLLSASDTIFDDMLRRADDAMYTAKVLGRNRMQLDKTIAAI
ncbi:MAG: GGDEF domain-containing protein [Arenimonas sp.]